MTPLRLSLLGTPHFERGTDSLDLSSAKAVALLAFLALASAPQPRERVLDLLWPNSLAEAGRKNLRNTLWAIRRALGEDVIVADEDRLALNPDTGVDVRDFEHAAATAGNGAGEGYVAAAALYRGPLLDGLNLTDAPDFELWLTTQQERLGQLYLRALTGLIDRYEAEGDWRRVIETARQALTYDNLQEPIHRALMAAHARLGERPEALRQYDSLAATLEHELGVEPLAETRSLRAAILEGALQPDTPTRREASRVRRMGGTPDAAETAFVGRSQEKRALDAALGAAREGSARVVLLSGEVGIGKSRLWREWASGLGPDAVVLETRCLESMQSLPFVPLTELFGARACMERLRSAEPRVEPLWLAEIARLLPDIRTARPDIPIPPVLPPEEERRRLFEGFTRFIQAFGGQPLVFFIDDIHWADRATLDWLSYFVSRMRPEPLLLVAAFRPEEVTGTLAQLIASWGREGIAERVQLHRLTNEEAAALIAALGVSPLQAHQLQAQSAGNPYFLIEQWRSGLTDVPPVLKDLIRARLDRLPDSARQVLQAAAVLEADIDFDTLRRTSGRGEEETLDALDQLLDAAVLTERGQRYEFSHPLMGVVVREGLSGARRGFVHRRAAEALEATHTGRMVQIAGRLAHHYAQAGDAAKAGQSYEMAAEQALAVAAPEEAIGFYRAALAVEPTPMRQVGLGRTLLRQGDVMGAREVLESALAGFEADSDDEGAALACRSLGETYIAAGRFDIALTWMRRGLTYTSGQGDPASNALAHFLMGSSRLEVQQALDEAKIHLDEAVRLALEHDEPDLAARVLFALGNVHAQRGDLAGAIDYYRRAVSLAREGGDQYQEVIAQNNLAYHMLLAGDTAGARQAIEHGLALADQYALRLPRQHLYSTRGEVALAEGAWDEADEWFRRGAAEAALYGNNEQLANYYGNQALAARGRGDYQAAVEFLEHARSTAGELTAARHLQVQIDLWLAEAYQANGANDKALEALETGERKLEGFPYARLREWARRVREELSGEVAQDEAASGPPASA